jgi:putative membrane protein
LKRRKNILAGLGAAWLIVWIVAAIRPVDRQAWLLENLLVFAFVAILALMHRRLELSTGSYAFIAIFLMLHAVGAHYTYAAMPLGTWAKEAFGLARNPYDRVAHFAFGLLLSFPIREVLLRFGRVRSGWSLLLPSLVILSASGLFEIVEGIVAELVAPGKGPAWLGGQGDEWDAQNDMLAAFGGAIVTMVIAAVAARRAQAK